MGLSENQAQSLAQKTCLGAAMMAIDSSESLTELRRRVTSPNGTTEAAINKFIEKDFSAVIDQSLQAAFDRSQALSKELS